LNQSDEISIPEIIELNYHTGLFNNRLMTFVTKFLKNLKKDFQEKGLLKLIKNGFSSFVDLLSEKLVGSVSDPDVQLINL
jgi:hypothetical protein